MCLSTSSDAIRMTRRWIGLLMMGILSLSGLVCNYERGGLRLIVKWGPASVLFCFVCWFMEVVCEKGLMMSVCVCAGNQRTLMHPTSR